MIGWGFDIYRQKGKFFPCNHLKPATQTSEQGDHVAAWRAELGGVDWLEDLARQQRAFCLIADRYHPALYTAQAKDVLPLLRVKPPLVMEVPEWIDGRYDKLIPDFYKSESLISSCAPDEWLMITIWDLS